MGESDMAGQVNFPGLQAGTYRLRFSSNEVTAFEREVTLRAGQVESFDVALTAAPPPMYVPAPAAAAPAAAAAMGPAGSPQLMSIVELADRELSAKEPRAESLISCSGNTRTTLVILSKDQPQRLYDGAEATYYVVAGQGSVRMGSKDTSVAAGSFVSIPRAHAFSIGRRGNKPLVLLATLSGEPCEMPK
jgi:mannose-6-phosphate isomerase-like protein (cupin superfamily)